MISTDHLVRTACRTMAAHGDGAVDYARARARAAHDDPAAAATWVHVSNVIKAIFDEGFFPGE